MLIETSLIDTDTHRAARRFVERIAPLYAIDRVILFGSRARQTHHPESDADIAVVLKGAPGERSAAAIDMAGIAFDVLLETGILVDALPLWNDDIDYPGKFSNPALMSAIRREGIAL